MSRKLTQPEEIDQIVWAMVACDLEKLMPISGGTLPNRVCRDAPYDEYAAEPSVVHQDSLQS